MRRRRRRTQHSRGEGRFRRRKKWKYISHAFGDMCIYCGECPHCFDLSCDRVVPKSRGGTAIFWNIVPACVTCNSNRNSSSIVEFAKISEVDLSLIQQRWLTASIKLFSKYFKLRNKEFDYLGKDFKENADFELFETLKELLIDDIMINKFEYWPLKYALRILKGKYNVTI